MLRGELLVLLEFFLLVVSSPIKMQEEIGSFFSSSCAGGRFSIVLHTDGVGSLSMARETSEALQVATVSIVGSDGDCLARDIGVRGTRVWSIDLPLNSSECKINHEKTQYGVKYATTVSVTSPGFPNHSHQTYSYSFSCLLMDHSPEVGALFVKEATAWNQHSVVPDNEVVGVSFPVLHVPSHVYAYPVHCSTRSGTQSFTKIVQNGCPTMWNEDNFLSSLSQDDTFAGMGKATKVYFYPSKMITENSFSVECQVFLCSGSRHNAISDVPTCPTIANCEWNNRPAAYRKTQPRELWEGRNLTTVTSSVISVNWRRKTPMEMTSPIYRNEEIRKLIVNGTSSSVTSLPIVLIAAIVLGVTFALIVVAIFNYCRAYSKGKLMKDCTSTYDLPTPSRPLVAFN